MQRARKEKEIMNFTFCWILKETMKLAEIKIYHKKARNVFTFQIHLLDCNMQSIPSQYWAEYVEVK